jgi:hypothetical protein
MLGCSTIEAVWFMLFSRTNKRKSVGFILCGDYLDLHSANEMIHHVVSESPVLKSHTNLAMDEFILGLAYDIRKAYERQREIIKLDGVDDKEVFYYGVDVIFPCFILQLAALRWACGFTVVNRHQQSILYALEWVVESAMNDFDAETSSQIIKRLSTFGSMLQNEDIDSIENEIHDCWVQNKKRRFIDLIELLTNVTTPGELRKLIEEAKARNVKNSK